MLMTEYLRSIDFVQMRFAFCTYQYSRDVADYDDSYS